MSGFPHYFADHQYCLICGKAETEAEADDCTMSIEDFEKKRKMEVFIQPKITGYRQLGQVEADLINTIKAKGAEIERLLTIVEAYLREQNTGRVDMGADESARLERATPFRWHAIARTDFQTALMALTRAVAQSSSF